MNPYDVLELSPDATLAQVKSAYRRLSKLCHPDKVRDGQATANEWRLLQSAYEVLSDPIRRERYDSTGRTEDSAVTPARLKDFLRSTLISVIEGQSRHGGTEEIYLDVCGALIREIKETRPAIKIKMNEAKRRLDRAKVMKQSFKPTGLRMADDIVGGILQAEIDKIQSDYSLNEGMLELSEEAERVLAEYVYVYEVKADQASEGQYETRSATARRRFGGIIPQVQVRPGLDLWPELGSAKEPSAE